MKIWRKLSLRIRLTLLYAALLALMLAILGATFFIDTRNLLIENTASHIRARAKPIVERWLYNGGFPKSPGSSAISVPDLGHLKRIAKRLARDLTSKDTVAIVIDKKGHILANGKLLPEEPSPPTPMSRYYREALAGNNEVTYIVSENARDTLVLLIPLRSSPGSRKILGVVQLASPLTAVENTLYRHVLVLAAGSIVTLLLGSGLGLLLVSSTLSELGHMINTCESIKEGNLSERVNLPQRSDEIGQLARAFDGMVEKMEATFEAQKRFVANAAHELRTPLTALRGSLEVLLRGAQDDPSAVARLSQGMYREVLRLSRLCEELLDLAKLGLSENIRKVMVNLGEFFDEFLSQAKTLAGAREIRVKEGPFVHLSVDPDMLKQIMFDLVQNAVQNTSENGRITIGWELDPQGITIWVEDDGCGILPEDLPRIFEPFYRGKSCASRVRETRSAGLGLTLVKAMVEAHNGSIEVFSETGKGTKFVINFP